MCGGRLPEGILPVSQLCQRNGVDDVIVISGILLLVAVVFLVIGLFGSLAGCMPRSP